MMSYVLTVKRRNYTLIQLVFTSDLAFAWVKRKSGTFHVSLAISNDPAPLNGSGNIDRQAKLPL